MDRDEVFSTILKESKSGSYGSIGQFLCGVGISLSVFLFL
eukprot:gene11002-7645_t